MPAQWLSSSNDLPGRIGAGLERGLHTLSQPGNKRRIQISLLVIGTLWALFALARLVWALLPQPAPEAAPLSELVNPASGAQEQISREAVDMETLSTWQLFGTAVDTDELVAAESAAGTGSSREGIEDGARETRLDLTLRGIVASTEDGLGHAIIEHKSRQAVYAVEDELPVAGKVVLAKVMPKQVVLDNAGTYELLTLFDDSDLDRALASQSVLTTDRGAGGTAAGDTRQVDKRGDSDTSDLASAYRDQLYRDPGSLSEVVRITAVREGGELKGYRIAPGRARAQFTQLGFQSGDLVTSVNGMALDDPANTMRLYQTMRAASEAVFVLQRDGQPVSVSVSLEGGGPP